MHLPESPLHAAPSEHHLAPAERDRLQQFGNTIVHDLNNAIFAITGRLELLKRRLENPALQGLAGELGKTIAFFESINASIASACARNIPHGQAVSANETLATAIDEALFETQESLREIRIERADLPLSTRMFRVPASALAICFRQLLALHAIRLNGAGALSIASRFEAASLLVVMEDDQTVDAAEIVSLTQSPSFLQPGFAFEQLFFATAARALRDFGGKVALERTAAGCLRSTVSLTLVAETRRVAQRVLIADDEMLIRALLVQMLETLGADVVPCDDPSSIDTHPDLSQQELIVVDAAMPTQSGLRALQRLRANGVMIPAVVISGAPIDEALPAKTSALLKPFTMASFEAACQAAFAS